MRKRKNAPAIDHIETGRKSSDIHCPTISSMTTIEGSSPIACSTFAEAMIPSIIASIVSARSVGWTISAGNNNRGKYNTTASALPAVPDAMGE